MRGEAIYRLRVAKRIQQQDLAQWVGRRKEWLSRIENGHEQPSDIAAARLADLLECTVEDFSSPKPPVARARRRATEAAA